MTTSPSLPLAQSRPRLPRPSTLPLTLLLLAAAASAQPLLRSQATVNSADYSRMIAPGALISIFGSNLASATDTAQRLPLPTTLAGATVEIVDGARVTPAPLYFVSPGQINAMLPYDTGASVQVRVRTSVGTSNSDTIAVSPRAPRFFAVDLTGTGRIVSAHADGQLLMHSNPGKPGEIVVLYLNSVGAVDPPIPAGSSPGDGGVNPLNVVKDSLSATLDGRAADVVWAGLAPYFAGLYQFNVRLPYFDTIGDLPVKVRVGTAESQDMISLAVEPNGFYWVVPAGKFPNGQTLTGVSGSSGAIAFLHDDAQSWGNKGFRAWTKDLGLGAAFSQTSGLALTLKNGNTIVYDNSGIETASTGTYYSNAGSGTDADTPGLSLFYSMSNLYPAVFATYFRLAQRTAFDTIVGYFDGNGQSELPFDPSNIFNRYRVNIWSNSGGVPRVNQITGDVLSSDGVSGTFSFSDTGVARAFRGGRTDAIYRLEYSMKTSVTLEAGKYWLSHDVAVPVSSPSKSPAAKTGFRPHPRLAIR